MGGMGGLLPLLEQVCLLEQGETGGQEISDLIGPELTSSRGPAGMLLPLGRSSGQYCTRSELNNISQAHFEPHVNAFV